MADKMPKEIVMSSCSKYEDTELNIEINKKRKLSISESEYDYNDHSATSCYETSTNKISLCKDNQSNSVCKRTSEQSLSDVIQKLTQQIEHIEKKVAKSQNVMKNIKVNDDNCDDELLYQPPNKIMKYDNIEIMNANSCNSDENSTRKSKSLTNQEIEMFLDLPYNFKDEIIFHNENNTHIKTQEVQTNKEKSNRFVCKGDVVFFETDCNFENELILNSDPIVLSQNNEDNRVTMNSQIENSIVELCYSENETLLGIKTNGDYYEEETVEGIIKQIIEDIMVLLDSSNSSLSILNVSKCVNDYENISGPVNESFINSESQNIQEKMGCVLNSSANPLYELQRTVSETNEQNNNDMDTISKSTFDKILIESRRNNEKFPSDDDKTTVSQIIENEVHRIDSVDIPNQADHLNMSIKHVLDESKLYSKKIGMSTEDLSISLSKDCSESNIINQREKCPNNENEVNDDGVDVSQMCENNVVNSSNSKSNNQDDFSDLTKCVNDKIMPVHENRTSIIIEDIECTSFSNQKDLSYSTKCVYDEIDSTIMNKKKSLSSNFGMDVTAADIYENAISERNSQSLVTGDQFKSNMFYFGTENCRNVSVHTIHSSVCHKMNNCSRNNITIQSVETNDSLLFPINEIEVNGDEVVFPQSSDTKSINRDDFLHLTKCVNDKIMLENDNGISKMNTEQKNESFLKILTVEEEGMLNNEGDELRILTDSTDKITVSQTSENDIHENDSKILLNQDDFLELTMRVHDENASITHSFNTFINHENDETIFNVKEIDNFTDRSLSFNSSNAKQILESSNGNSEHFDDSLLFMPSDRDLVKYGVVCEEYENSISQSLNNLENNIGNKEIVSQCKFSRLKFNEVSKSINNLESSSYAKDYENNVVDFYDCELSSIENSDVEDNLLLSFEKDTSIDNCIFDKNQDKLKNATISTSNEQTCDNNLKTQNAGSPSLSCNNLTNVVESPVSLIYSPSHQYNKIISTSMSEKQMKMNPGTDDKLEILNHSNVKITTSNTIPSFDNSDNNNAIHNDLTKVDQGNFNEEQNLEDSNKSHNQNNKNKSISGFITHQKLKSCKDNESESSEVPSMKITENCTIPKLFNEEIAKINTVQSSSFDIDESNLNSEIDKKKYLDEIIKNDQLFNKFDEKLDANESVISPYISQSLAKSINLKSALAKKAAANINIHAMGDKALCTYLTQQTMTLDVLEVLHKSLDTCPTSGILMEDPEGLVVPLMPHQKHGIAWLIWRESQEPRGGILADDMGLGKTLSMISLILKLKEKSQYSLLPVVSIDNRRDDDIIGGTLVICPASLLNQWESEVQAKLKPGLLKVGQYYGINRSLSALELAKNDLVTTSYNVVMWDHKLRQNSSPIFKIKWNRIILDEAHIIRNHKTQTSVAVCNIKSLNRWAITGTPVHNKEADFFTLLKFVRCKPFDDWPVWKRWVGNNDKAGKHRLSLLVKTLMLRRTKLELTQFTAFNLPTKEVNIIEIELSIEEQNVYEKLLQFSSNLFATYLYDRAAKEKLFDSSIKVQCKIQYFQEQNQVKDEVFKDHPELLKLFRQFKNIEEIQTYHILVLLLRLRQICCHPVLIKGPITEETLQNENMESISEDVKDVSYNENTNIDTISNLSDLMSSLTLDEPVEKNYLIESDIFKKSWISTKIKKICDLVNQKVLINGNGDKAIIVSQWPSFLYLIRKHLAHYNAKMEMFSGAIPISKRNNIIHEFNKPKGGPQILLLSLKAGGVGLNLMVANHMFLVDVHWNPQLENQASDRIYRVGQTKPVHIYKFICSNTIETRILNIQTHKLQIAENVFKGTSVNSSKITIDDLKQIFQFH